MWWSFHQATAASSLPWPSPPRHLHFRGSSPSSVQPSRAADGQAAVVPLTGSAPPSVPADWYFASWPLLAPFHQATAASSLPWPSPPRHLHFRGSSPSSVQPSRAADGGELPRK